MRPSASTILEKAFRSTVVESGEPSSPDVAMVQKILDDKSLPAVAEPGMAYIVHWADGRGRFAVRKKSELMPWLKKTGEMAEIVSIKYMKPEFKGKKLRVSEAEVTDITQTPAFKAWFGKSKVVDKQGRPLVVYHGTNRQFDSFKVSTGLYGKGVYFATSAKRASKYATFNGDENAMVIPVYVRLLNPADGKDYDRIIKGGKGDTSKLMKAGFDGIMFSDEIVAFSPTQVKSAIGNKGTFDPTSPKLTEGVEHIPGLLLEEVFTAKDIDLDKTYGTFKASYEKQTGKAWDKAKFLERIKDWTLYGDHDGFVAARQQASGPIKLVGAAGNPIGVKKGFQEVLAAGKPVWGAMDLRLATLAARMGLKMPPAWLMVRILTAIKDRFAAASGLEPSAIQVNKDGSLTITYPDVGAATKFIVGNKKYFEWLLKTHGSALPAMLRTAISYFLTTGKPPPMPADQDEEPFTLDDKPKVPPTPPDTEVSDAPPQEAPQR